MVETCSLARSLAHCLGLGLGLVLVLVLVLAALFTRALKGNMPGQASSGRHHASVRL